MLWSVVVVELPRIGFRFSANQLFWLAALPGLAGASLRLVLRVPGAGVRRPHVHDALDRRIAHSRDRPRDSRSRIRAPAIRRFSRWRSRPASAAAISPRAWRTSAIFYPSDRKGTALGWNASLGNLGVGLAQIAVPLAIGARLFGAIGGPALPWSDGAATREIWLQNAGYVWVPLIVAATLAAWFGMDDLGTR